MTRKSETSRNEPFITNLPHGTYANGSVHASMEVDTIEQVCRKDSCHRSAMSFNIIRQLSGLIE